MNRQAWKSVLDKLSERELLKLLLTSDDCGKANILGTDYVPEPTDVFSPAFVVDQMEKQYNEKLANKNIR